MRIARVHPLFIAVAVFQSVILHGQTKSPVQLPEGIAPLAPTVIGTNVKITFDPTPVSQISFEPYTQPLATGQSITVKWQKGTYFKEAHQCNTKVTAATQCLMIFAFEAPQTAGGTVTSDTASIVDGGSDNVLATVTISGSTATPQPAAAPQQTTTSVTPSGTTTTMTVTTCRPPDRNFLPTVRPSLLSPSKAFPAGSEELAERAGEQFGRWLWGEQKEAVINCYYQTDESLAFFTQVKGIYNANSGSETLSANIGSYNFNDGMQMTLGTNIQTGASPALTSKFDAAGLPTLAATAAAQAAQNLFFGGNIFLYDDFPILTKKPSGSGRWHFDTDILGREGVDVQNFTGTSTTVTTPNTHFDLFDEGYWQYDADPAANSQTVPLSIFIGGQYGYTYTSHAYARDYGFINKANADAGDLSFGLLVTGAFNVSILREFGPSQKYVDSTSGATTTVNNFKSWSFGIQYQSKGLSTSQ